MADGGWPALDERAGSVRTRDGARTGPTPLQYLTLAVFAGAALAAGVANGALTGRLLHGAIVLGVVLAASAKLLLAGLGRPPTPPARLRRDRLPTYTILAPLYREAAVLDQLIQALAEIDYPRDRLQAILILEPDDTETLDALAWMQLPRFVEVLVNPSGGPRTKPNALNAALPLARGEHLVVYDAEDRPHPEQLREAAARFAADPRLGCLQAPLRIANAGGGFLARQFALEYAGQFDAVIPGLVRFGAPYPLGGTSNHFRTETLRHLGGWDPYNVTEDADLGFALAERRERMGVLAAPTLEDAPVRFDDWLPQRTRWIKGYMQTWGVHMRAPWRLGWRGFLSLQATLGAAIMGAALHGGLMLMLVASVLTDVLGRWAPLSLAGDFAVLGVGWGMAVLANRIGARRAGLAMTLNDAVASLAYWPLQSLAFVFAAQQLVKAPHHWDKTAHAPANSTARPSPERHPSALTDHARAA